MMSLPASSQVSQLQAANELAARRKARSSLLAFTQYTFPQYRPNWHHELLCDYLERFASGEIKRLIVAMPPRHGKCLAIGTPILMADGTHKPIEAICPFDMVKTVDKCYNTVISHVVSMQENGVKPVREITLFSGRKLVCTANHPLLTVHGWQAASDLVKGDAIAVLSKAPPVEDTVALPYGFAALIGYLVGDGSFGQGNPIITTAEPATVEHLKEIADYYDWKLYRDGEYGYHVRRRTGRRGKRNGSSAQEMLRNYLEPAKSVDKFVPECIKVAPDVDIVEFLAAYFYCDGSVNEHREGVAEFYSVSKKLLDGVQALLWRFGIYSSLRLKKGRYKGDVHTSWRLILSGQDIIAFANIIPIRGVKGDKLVAVANTARNRNHYPEYAAIPTGWKQYMDMNSSWHRIHICIRVDKQYKRGTARHLVEAIAEIEDNDKLRRLCNPDIIWERITEIKEVGEQPTFDLQIEHTENFIANGIVVHNSELLSRRLPAYMLGRDPNMQLMATSYAATLSQGFNRDIQRIIDNEAYHRLFPETMLSGKNIRTVAQGTWLRNSEIFEIVGHSGVYRNAGVGGGITGFGFDRGFIDDVIKNAKEANSETLRNAIDEWYTSTFWTRQQAGAGIAIVLTRWHLNDLVGRILERAEAGEGEQWEVLELPAVMLEPDKKHPDDPREYGEALWPSDYPIEFLNTVELQNKFVFAALYQQNPIPAGAGLFDTSQIDIVEDVPAKLETGRFYDLAVTAKKTSDYTAGVLMGIDKDETVYILDVYRVQKTPTQVEAGIVKNAQVDGKGTRIRLEAEKAGIMQLDYLLQNKILRGYALDAKPPVGDKYTRAQPFATRVNAGKVKMLKANWNRAFLDELDTFPMGAHDDQVDACSGAYDMLAMGSFRVLDW